MLGKMALGEWLPVRTEPSGRVSQTFECHTLALPYVHILHSLRTAHTSVYTVSNAAEPYTLIQLPQQHTSTRHDSIKY